MKLLDDFIYATCCLVVVLHTLSALLVITHGRCSVYAAAFLIACLMWLDVSILNLWFFVPTIAREFAALWTHLSPSLASFFPPLSQQQQQQQPREGGDLLNVLDILAEVFLGSAASYLYMMLFGWFVGSMSLSNALAMWQKEGCSARDAHCHSGPVAVRVIRWARRAEDLVGIWDAGYLPFQEAERGDGTSEEDGEERRTSQGNRWWCSSCLFAGPRWLHRTYLFILSPPVKLLSRAPVTTDIKQEAVVQEKMIMGLGSWPV